MKNKLFCTLFIIPLSFSWAFAQKNLCTFQTGQAAYSELTGDSSLNSILLINDTNTFRFTSFEDENFYFYGEPWLIKKDLAEISVFRNGRIVVLKDTSFGLFDGLYALNFDTIGNTTKVSFKVEGSGNQKILKVQWKNFKIRTGPADNYVNLQTWIYQASGVIEYRYGPRSANNASGYTNPVTAPYIGIWYSNYSFSNIYEKMNLKGLPTNIIVDSALNMSVPHFQGVPAEGTMFRFVPKKSVTTGLLDINKEKPEIYQESDGRGFIITLPDLNHEITVSLFDLSGKKILQKTELMLSKQLRISTADFTSGIYLIRVEYDGKQFYEKLAVKEG